MRRVIAAGLGGDGFVQGVTDVRSLALQAIEAGCSLTEMVERLGIGGLVDLGAELAAGRLIAPWGFVTTEAQWVLATPARAHQERATALARWLAGELREAPATGND